MIETLALAGSLIGAVFLLTALLGLCQLLFGGWAQPEPKQPTKLYSYAEKPPSRRGFLATLGSLLGYTALPTTHSIPLPDADDLNAIAKATMDEEWGTGTWRGTFRPYGDDFNVGDTYTDPDDGVEWVWGPYGWITMEEYWQRYGR